MNVVCPPVSSQQHQLLGLVSFGWECAGKNRDSYPGVGTKLTAIYPWLIRLQIVTKFVVSEPFNHF